MAPAAALAGEAQTRIIRTLAIVFGIATVVFGVLLLPSIQTQTPMMAVSWSLFALLGLFGVPVGMSLAAPRSSVRAIKRWAAVIAVAQVVVLITWVPFMTVPAVPSTASSPWVFGVTAVGTSAAAIAWRGRYLWIYIPATGALVFIDRALTSPEPLLIPFQDALYTVTFSAVFAALASVCVSGSAELDRAAANARQETAAEAVHRAEHSHRTRVNALLHDQVLVTLLVASESVDPRLRGVAAAQAKRTLADINQYESDTSPQHDWRAQDVVWQLQGVATDTDPGAVFAYEFADGDPTTVPSEVVKALAEGLSEALRNILRHAQIPGADLHRAVHVRVNESGVRTEILDDGRGFDPGSVPHARLGIAVSIRERMAALPGGSSDLVSIPGQGTRVVLRWVRP